MLRPSYQRHVNMFTASEQTESSGTFLKLIRSGRESRDNQQGIRVVKRLHPRRSTRGMLTHCSENLSSIRGPQQSEKTGTGWCTGARRWRAEMREKRAEVQGPMRLIIGLTRNFCNKCQHPASRKEAVRRNGTGGMPQRAKQKGKERDAVAKGKRDTTVARERKVSARSVRGARATFTSSIRRTSSDELALSGT